mmetsp:Transcript_27746/g.55842  ORF Transcript_27746/g.55842 Transcript_27746/m.55842 type:complete len:186 (+) Transcript_27746:1813-2370(+)
MISMVGAAPQILHPDTVFTPTPQMFTAFVALQDVSRSQGPTRFLPGSHDGEQGALAHHMLANNGDGEDLCKSATSCLGLLSVGDATLFDSRLLHCGGPHVQTATLATAAAPDVTMPGSAAAPDAMMPGRLPTDASTERVLFYVSFRHTLAAAALSNSDMHGVGSIRPELAALELRLGELRNPVEA